MKKIFFLLSILMLTGCQNPEQKESKLHNNTTTIEKFDFEIYNKTNQGSNEYTLSNGNIIYSMVFLKMKAELYMKDYLLHLF